MPEGRVGAIIAAGGHSARMGGPDKLFADLGGKPLLYHSLNAFQSCAAVHAIVLVMSEANLARARALVSESGFSKVIAVCPGGARRRNSVAAGLAALAGPPPCQWVVAHDGARPLVTAALIEAGLTAAQETGAAVCARPASDTIKEADALGRVQGTLDRSRLWLVQTPQVFRYDILQQAHKGAPASDVTDDAALVERLGVSVRLYTGSARNIKVTTPEDLAIAEAMLRVGQS